MELRARDRTRTVRRDVERNRRHAPCVLGRKIRQRRWLDSRDVQRRHALGKIAAETEDVADRKRLDRRVHRQVGVVDAVDRPHGHDGARARAVEGGRQFGLSPELRQQCHDQARAQRSEHRQHELDGIRQLDGDDGCGRKPGIDELGGQRGDRKIRFRVGQPDRRLAGDPPLVRRVDQGGDARLTGNDPAKNIVERGGCAGRGGAGRERVFQGPARDVGIDPV